MFFIRMFSGRTKESMAEFLVKHSRYYTMNSWNGTSSYSNVCKLHSLGLRGGQLQKAYEVIQLEDLHDLISMPIQLFTAETNGAYTVGFNGRSGGHMVLYAGEYFDTGHKSRCTKCGQLNFQSVSDDRPAQCGVCSGARVNLSKPMRQHRVLNHGIDSEMSREDFMDLSLVELKNKVDLVQTFDRVCDQVRDDFIQVLDDYMVVEETVMIPKQVRRLERV